MRNEKEIKKNPMFLSVPGGFNYQFYHRIASLADAIQ